MKEKKENEQQITVCTVTNNCIVHQYQVTIFFKSSVSAPNNPRADIPFPEDNNDNSQIDEARILTLKEPNNGEELKFNDHKEPYIIGKDPFTGHPHKVWVSKDIEKEGNFIKQITIDDPQ